MSASDIFETWAKQLGAGFNGPTNQALWGGMAAVVGDRTLDDAQAMVTESLPLQASAAANGLTANDRGLVKGPSESDADFAARLVAYRYQWSLAGTPVGLLIQLYYSGFQSPVLVQQNGRRHQLTATPDLGELAAFVAAWRAQEPVAFPSWYTAADLAAANPAIPASTDGKPAIPANTVPWWMFDAGMDGAGNQWCSRFGLVYPTSGGTPPDFTDAQTLGQIRRLIAAWKPASRRCAGIWVAGHSVVYGMGRKYGDGGKYGGSGAAFFSVE